MLGLSCGASTPILFSVKFPPSHESSVPAEDAQWFGNPCRASLRSVRLLSLSSRFRSVRIVPNYFPSTYRGTNSVQRDDCTTTFLVAYHFHDSPEVFVQSDLSAATVVCITFSSSTDHYENDFIAFATDGRKRACGVWCMGVISS
jgi:hypothetical protein